MGHDPLNQVSLSASAATDPLSTLIRETRSALVVVDMQVDFCAADGFIAGLGLDPAPCRDIVDSLQALVDGAREVEVPVLWVMADYRDDLVPLSSLRRKRQAGTTRDCCVPGTEGYEPFGVVPAKDDPRFIKHSFSAFTNPDFEAHLRAAGIETLVFTGVQTNVCVEATLREAFNRGFHVVVAEDCVASHTPALHDATLQNVRTLLGTVASSGDVRDAWRRSARSSS